MIGRLRVTAELEQTSDTSFAKGVLQAGVVDGKEAEVLVEG